MMKKLISGLVLLAMLACLVLPAAAAEPTALPMTVAEAASDPHVLAALDRAVERANRHVSRAESIRKIAVLSGDFTEANGLLTPSLKVKRAEATRRFAPVIDEIYGGPVHN